METEVQLKRIMAKLQQVLKQHSSLQKENGLLKAELEQARQKAAISAEDADSLKQQVDVLRYSSGDLSGTDKKDFEKKINTYVKELDRCIAMLSR